MDNDKTKNIIIAILVLIIVVLFIVIGIVYQNKENYKESDDSSNQEHLNVENNDNLENNNSFYESYDESDFVRQTKVTLIEEPACTGVGGSLVASIEADGNISISKDGGAILITPGNAKYLYSVGKLACDEVELYYITEDNNLYLVDKNMLDSGMDQIAIKVTDSEVVEFLDVATMEVEDSYNHSLKVLLKNGKVEYINYLTTVK